jgi:3-mercaptopropionate dioxygenase
MNSDTLPAPLRRFVDETNTLLATEPDEDHLLPKLGESMRALVSKDDWLNPAFARPHPEYYQQYLLYADPADRFSVVSFVWGPGQHTPVHDHTVWGVIGMLRGAEIAQNYEIARRWQFHTRQVTRSDSHLAWWSSSRQRSVTCTR